MNWTWDQVTAISSTIGVLGGLISLFFLIFEVRRNAQAIEGGTVQSLVELEITIFDLLGRNASLYVKGSNNISDLSPEEMFHFDKLVSAQMSLYYSAHVQHNEKLIDEEMWNAYIATIHAYLRLPGFLAMWKSMESMYPKTFRDLARQHSLTDHTGVVA